MKRTLTPEEIEQRACAYCAQAEHCEQEIREKLWQWGCSDTAEQQKIIDLLLQEDYINDERYCRAYCHDKVAYQGWGRVKIRMMLQSKRLPGHFVEKALQDISAADYKKALAKAVGKYSAEERERTIRFALQRGFEYNEILEFLSSDHSSPLESEP